MDLLLPAHSGLMRQLHECLQRWETMQASTHVYLENAAIDLDAARSVSEATLGVLDPALVPAIASSSRDSAELMLRGLRKAIDALERVLDAMREAQATGRATLSASQLHEATLLGWLDDCVRMFAAELMHKRMILASVEDERTARRSLAGWTEEPFLNRALLARIEAAVLPTS